MKGINMLGAETAATTPPLGEGEVVRVALAWLATRLFLAGVLATVP